MYQEQFPYSIKKFKKKLLDTCINIYICLISVSYEMNFMFGINLKEASNIYPKEALSYLN